MNFSKSAFPISKFFKVALFLFVLASCSKVKFLASGNGDLPELSQGAEVAKINNTPIRQGYLDLIASVNPRVKAQLENPLAKKQIVQNIVEQELIYQEAIKRGLGNSDDIRKKVVLYQRIVTAQALLEDELNKKSREYYDAHKDSEFTKVKVSIITFDFTPTPLPANGKEPAVVQPSDAQKQAALKKATDAKARADKGDDFAKLAEELSDDKITKRKGGDLGPISKDDKRLARRGMEAISPVAFTLKKDQVSDPIETKDGYALIKVTSDPEATPFEEADKLVRFQIQREVKDTLVTSLQASGKITYADEPTAAPAPLPSDSNHGAELPPPPSTEGAPTTTPPAEGTPVPAPAPTPAPETGK